ncbi:MAG: LPS export ABC transporter periplasmic protein LptC [Nitrospirota bacterium]
MPGIENVIKKILIGIILLLLTAGVFFLSRKKETTIPVIPSKGEADIVMEDFSIPETESKGGGLKWELKAKKAEVYKPENKTILYDLEARFTMEDGKKMTLIADAGVFNTATKDMIVQKKEKDVKVISENGYVLTTTTLRWVEAERRIMTDEPVLLTGSKLRVEGKGLLFNVDNQIAEVLRDVKTTLYSR